MAQSGYTPILIYGSGTPASIPLAANMTSSSAGAELALNYADGKLYYKNSSGVVTLLAQAASASPVTSFQTSLGGLTPNTSTTGAITLAGTLNTTSGGTGLTSFTAGDLIYFASGTSFTKLGIGTNGQVLTSTGTAPQWSTLSTGVTTFSAGTTGFTPSTATSGAITLAGTLATTNGGTGLTSFISGGAVYATSTSALATGTLPNTAGGTGQSSAFTQYGVTYASTTTALATTSAGTTTTVLHGNASGAPTFGAVSLTADVSGVLGPANGGTGVANNAASTITISGSFATTFTVSGAYNYTFPAASDTLVNLGSSQTLTNKTLTNPTVTNYIESVVAIGNSSTSQTLSLTSGTVQTVTMTGNCTFTMPTATAGKSFILIVSTGAGGFTGTFTSVKWPSNTAPTLTTTASRWDILTFVADGTNWYGTYAQAFQ